MWMKVKVDKVSDQYAQMYFGLLKEEVNRAFGVVENAWKNEEKQQISKEEMIEYVKSDIEDMIEEQIYLENLMPIGEKQYHYFLEPKIDQPLIVLVKFLTVPLRDCKLTLPKTIDPASIQPENIEEDVERIIQVILEKHGYCRMSAAESVTETSTITYDLIYEEDGHIINTVKELYLNMEEEEEIPIEKFLNKKVGDRLLLDQDKVNLVAEIKAISKMTPVTLTDMIVAQLDYVETKTVKEFKQKIHEVLYMGNAIHNTMKKVLDEIIIHQAFELDPQALAFFKKYEGAGLSDAEAEKELKSMIFYRYLVAFITGIKTEAEETGLLFIGEEFDLLCLCDEEMNTDEEFEFYLNKRIPEIWVYQYYITEQQKD